MKPLQINDLPHDILTGAFSFEYEVILIDAAAPETYDRHRCKMLADMELGIILVKYERIGPEPKNTEALKLIKGMQDLLLKALDTVKEAT